MDTEKTLYAAKVTVGTLAFVALFLIFKSIGLSVFAVQLASPELTATQFNLGLIATDILLPLFGAYAFVALRVGSVIVTVVASIIERLTAQSEVAELATGKVYADADATAANFDKVSAELSKLKASLNQHASVIKSVKAKVEAWETE